jgi:hypothetical protein
MKRRVIQTFWDSTTILGSTWATPSHLEDWIPKSYKHNEVIEGKGEVLLLQSGDTLKEVQIFSQEQESRLGT